MTNPRKAVYDAIRAGMGSLAQSDVIIMENALDRIGYPSEDAASGARKTSKRGIDLIHSFESCKLKAYPDPGTGGKPYTIGWGSTTDESGNPIALGTVWTQERADARFALDLAKFEKAVTDALSGSTATQNQFDALVSFTYNLGEGNLRSSTLLKKHKAGDYAGAKAEFAKWNKANKKVMAGLTRRRAAEAELYGS